MTKDADPPHPERSTRRRDYAPVVSVVAIATGLMIGVAAKWFGIPTSVMAAALTTGCFVVAAGFAFRAVYSSTSASMPQRLLLLVGALIFLLMGVFWLSGGI